MDFEAQEIMRKHYAVAAKGWKLHVPTGLYWHPKRPAEAAALTLDQAYNSTREEQEKNADS